VAGNWLSRSVVGRTLLQRSAQLASARLCLSAWVWVDDADGSTENVSGQHERPLQVTVIGDHDGGIAVVDEGVSCALASPVNGSTVTWGTGTQRRALGVGAGLGSAPWPLRSGGHHWAWRWFNNRAGGGAERMGPTPPAPRPAAPSEDAHG